MALLSVVPPSAEDDARAVATRRQFGCIPIWANDPTDAVRCFLWATANPSDATCLQSVGDGGFGCA